MCHIRVEKPNTSPKNKNISKGYSNASPAEESPVKGYQSSFGEDQVGGKYDKFGESPVKPTFQRKYPGGSNIPMSLPKSYNLSGLKDEKCHGCYFNKEGYCIKWEAMIKPEYHCNSFALIGVNDNLIELKKNTYGAFAVSKIVDKEFSELINNDKKDTSKLFRLYDDLFFDIPKRGGKESHENLVIRSRNYLRNFIDPKDAIIEGLRDEVEILQNQILSLQSQDRILKNVNSTFDKIEDVTIPKFDINDLNPSADPSEDDPDADVGVQVTAQPLGEDLNMDGIADEEQELSTYGTTKHPLLIARESNTLTGLLQNKNHWYYKDEHYGKTIYAFTRKLNGVKNYLVILLGSRGERGHRYIRVLHPNEKQAERLTFKIPKRLWTYKNRWPREGYTLE